MIAAMLIVLLALTSHHVALGLPLQMTVNQKATECVYESLEKDERATVSVFLLSGPELKASLTFEGPIATVEDINTASDLLSASDGYVSIQDDEHMAFSKVLDFEHLRPELEDDDDDDDDEGDLKQKEGDGETDPERRQRQREEQRKQFMIAKEKREKQRALEQKMVREDGEPFIYTGVAPSKGWYKVCIQATVYQVLAELELRKESELGGLDKELHVLTYEEMAMQEEDKLLEQDTASDEGIKDADFQETRTLLKDLRKLLNQIQSMQQQERRRLTIHAETNSHSHSRMVLSSVLDTLLFMAVTSYQVYTIRKWFSGAPALGR